MRKLFKAINRQFGKLDRATSEMAVSVYRASRPGRRRRQAIVLATKVDRKVLEISRQAIARETRENLWAAVVRLGHAARSVATEIREDMRVPDEITLQDEAELLAEQLGEFIQSTELDWPIELNRWQTIMSLEASGGPDRLDSQAFEVFQQMTSEPMMRAGDRMMSEAHTGAIGDDVEISEEELRIVSAILQSRMTYVRAMYARNEISQDDLVSDLVTTRLLMRDFGIDEVEQPIE